MKPRAFTLVELLVVVTICAILVGIGACGWYGCCGLRTFDVSLIGFTVLAEVVLVGIYKFGRQRT